MTKLGDFVEWLFLRLPALLTALVFTCGAFFLHWAFGVFVLWISVIVLVAVFQTMGQEQNRNRVRGTSEQE